MKINIFPCQGRCNVSIMTKTVAQFFDSDEEIFVLPNLGLLLDEENNCKGEADEKFVAVNGCPAECASKEFMTNKIDPHEVVTITKDFDPDNNRKYEVLLDISEEISLVQEAIDNIYK